MKIVSGIAELAEYHGGAFVPTMGALHEGHLSLIRQAADLGSPVVVSVFVNPTQFGPDDDLAEYPRQLETDVAASESAGADVVFAPEVETMYPRPRNGDTEKSSLTPFSEDPPLPGVAVKPALEDACRPGHFEGVCQVVARLFDLVVPRWAVFGEKDYQQLLVIMAMVEEQSDRWAGLEIIAGETVREVDGLAMSSRNAYLEASQRDRALGLSRALRAAGEVAGGAGFEATPGAAERVMGEKLEAHDLRIDYAVVRDAADLSEVDSFDRPTRGIIAAHLDEVRLIDNMALPIRKEEA